MPRSSHRRTTVVPAHSAGLVCLLVILAVTGCGTSATPEHTAALDRLQALGGKINFERGGYHVDMQGTGVQDKDLEQLKHIANLKSLDLRGTRITDKGLTHVQALGALEQINLVRTETTRDSVERLKAARPNLEVTR
jgi:hypothetical protein